MRLTLALFIAFLAAASAVPVSDSRSASLTPRDWYCIDGWCCPSFVAGSSKDCCNYEKDDTCQDLGPSPIQKHKAHA